MKNFKIDYKGKEFWISRAVAVALFAFAYNDNNEVCVLANQRGKGTPNHQGEWNCSCGYLDFDETTKEAAIRETFEETGVKIDKEFVHFIGFNSNPKSDEAQNVTFRYAAELPKKIKIYEKQFSHKNNEDNEVSNIKFIPLKELKKYKWAFNHQELILKAWKKLNVMV